MEAALDEAAAAAKPKLTTDWNRPMAAVVPKSPIIRSERKT